MTSARARAVADAVLYEGYLLYPYRASSGKNQSRWQFGVLGPPGAAESGLGEDSTMSAQFLVEGGPEPTVTLTVRFLQLQHRGVEDSRGNPVGKLIAGDRSWISWDEAVEREEVVGPLPLRGALVPLDIPGGTDIETIEDGGRLVRTREPVVGEVELTSDSVGDLTRLTVTVRNTGAAATDKRDAIARSCIGAHIIAEVHGGAFISLLEPPDDAAQAAANCVQHRCFPVLAGAAGDSDVLLISPIILYDHPEIAEQSEGALFDSTEIDEILTLRVMTMTDVEKAQARATDPLAAQLIDRCDSMTPESMQRLHGALRAPHFGAEPVRPAIGDEQPRLVPEIPDGIDWWDPLADNAVAPETDAVLVAGVRVAKGSHVRLHPSRRADAQDLFFDGKLARVTAVHEDVDGQAHVAVVIDDDPAADLHEWYGRYLYFAPDEVEPVSSPQK